MLTPSPHRCELHEDFIDEATIDGHSGCLSACHGTDETGLAEKRYKMMIKPVFKKAIGNGGCFDVEEEGVRTQAEECENHGEDRRCRGDEVCADKMDLVIGYECSSSTTKLGRREGFWKNSPQKKRAMKKKRPAGFLC